MKRFLWLLFAAALARADVEPPDWWEVQQEVVRTLTAQKSTLVDLTKHVTEAKPATAREAMVKVAVLMRAGMDTEAVGALQELKALSPKLPAHQVGHIYYAACDEFQAWEVARGAVEMFAEIVDDLSLENRLLQHWDQSGWTYEQVDAWLADKPAGHAGFWVKQRMAYAGRHGRAAALAQQLSEAAQRNPQDVDGVILLLDALIAARRSDNDQWNVAWIADEVAPKLATKSVEVANRLQQFGERAMAVQFYRLAVETPLTEAEVQQMAMMRQVEMSAEKLRAAFAATTREQLAEGLLALGQSDEAQRWMVAAADLRQKHGFGMNARLAGEVQGASGQRVIEGRIREAEKKSEADPDYWRERALYYRGRSEPVQEEEAWWKGLALTKPLPKPERVGKGHSDQRGWMLRSYADFLARQKREDEAVAVLRRELAESPANAVSAEAAARMLAFDLSHRVSVGDEVLWVWLSNREKWEHTEERLLWRMLENAKREEIDGHFARSAELARATHPSRALTLGWIMNRMGFAQRSVAVLEDAARRAVDQELKERATFTLLESCLDTGDWKRAEAVFPVAGRRLSAKEWPEWQARIAARAAQAGAKTDALRIWRAVTAVHPGQMRELPELVKAGLREELVQHYRAMQRQLPTSRWPPSALECLF